MKNGLKIYLNEVFKKKSQTNSMFQEIKKEIESYGFNIDSLDFERPWGGF